MRKLLTSTTLLVSTITSAALASAQSPTAISPQLRGCSGAGAPPSFAAAAVFNTAIRHADLTTGAVGFAGEGKAAKLRLDANTQVDLITSDAQAARILVYLNPSISALPAPQIYAIPAIAKDLRAADFNNDGRPDVAVNVGNGVAILMNNGDGTLAAPQLLSAPSSGVTHSMTVGDYNLDGFLDLFVNNSNAGVAWRKNLGGGTFAASWGSLLTSFAFINPQPRGMVSFFRDSDGRVDTALTNSVDGIIVAKGLSTFGNTSSAATISFATSINDFYSTNISGGAIRSADLNGDGRDDLVSTRGTGLLSVMLNAGAQPYFPTTAAVSNGASGAALGLALGDLNLDGKVDMISANQASSNISVLAGNGNGTFQAPLILPAAGTANSVTLLDIDGDKDRDILLSYSTSGMALLENLACP